MFLLFCKTNHIGITCGRKICIAAHSMHAASMELVHSFGKEQTNIKVVKKELRPTDMKQQ